MRLLFQKYAEYSIYMYAGNVIHPNSCPMGLHRLKHIDSKTSDRHITMPSLWNVTKQVEEVPPLCVRSLQHNHDETLLRHAAWFGWPVHRVITGYDVIRM